MDKIIKAFSADVTIEADERAVVARISTVAVDRDHEVLVPQGCNTKDFEKSPSVFFNHDYWSLPVGKCTGIRRDDMGIIAKTVFAARPEDHPADEEWMPDTLYSLFKQKVLNSFSVGLIPLEQRPATDKDVQTYGADVRRVISKWKLLEYSVAPLPANQDAVAIAVGKGLVGEAMARAVWGFEAPAAEPEPAEVIVPSPPPIKRVYYILPPQNNASASVADVVRSQVQKSRGRMYLIP